MTARISELDVQTLARVEQDVTRGPWRATGHDRNTWWTIDKADGMPRQIARVMSSRSFDAAFIAMAREAVPKLIEERLQLRAALQEIVDGAYSASRAREVAVKALRGVASPPIGGEGGSTP